MKEFDYVIIGGGCAGLSLAYELEIHKKLEEKTLAIIEPRNEYKKDKTWSFWKVSEHSFGDCVEKKWENFSINIPNKTNYLECNSFPYQTINSEKYNPHILRHTFATHLVNKGANINAVKDLLGHSSLAATQIYTHNSIEKLKETFKASHPKA